MLYVPEHGYGVGDLVARLAHSRRMLVIDFIAGDLIVCGWRQAGVVHEGVYPASALRLLIQAPRPAPRR